MSGHSYFENVMRQMDLAGELASWMHPSTPFQHLGRTKGHGVDCVQLAVAVYQATALIGEVHLPSYSLQGGDLLEVSIIEEYIASLGHFDLVWQKRSRSDSVVVPPTMIGDLVLFQWARIPYHMGIMLGQRDLVHAHPVDGVVKVDVLDWFYLKRLRKVYRPY